MKRASLVTLLVLILLTYFTACSSTEPQGKTSAAASQPATSASAQTKSSQSDAGKNPATGGETVIRLTAKKFEYTPSQITVKKGTPVVIELTSKDRVHGFNIPDFKIRSDVKPGETTRVRFVPDKTGTFTFACDIYCGSGHEEMSGSLVVTD